MYDAPDARPSRCSAPHISLQLQCHTTDLKLPSSSTVTPDCFVVHAPSASSPLRAGPRSHPDGYLHISIISEQQKGYPTVNLLCNLATSSAYIVTVFCDIMPYSLVPQRPAKLQAELPDTAQSCSRHGVVAARLSSERPGSATAI